MNYELVRNVIQLLEEFEQSNAESTYTCDIEGFKHWVSVTSLTSGVNHEPNWESKENGRSAESVISTLLVHLNRYAKTYSKSAMLDSPFSTQEEFIYLINLKAFGAMGKMELIKMNIQDKPTGIQIINRLIKHGWVSQTDSIHDKRSKVIELTELGEETLNAHMSKIRQATLIVSGNLSEAEKLQLIALLSKLTDFHQSIFNKHIDSTHLLNTVVTDFLPR